MAEVGSLALAGIRVLEVADIAQGPAGCMLLADLGADVVKIERPTRGDPARATGRTRIGPYTAYFLAANCSKRSVCLDLKHPQAQPVLQRLVQWADVLVENLDQDSLERLGLTYEQLAPQNPRLVYVSITQFGERGPLARRRGADLWLQGFAGLMSVTGGPDSPPTAVGAHILDMATDLQAAYAAVTGLLARERFGVGQKIETNMLDMAVFLQSIEVTAYLNTGRLPQRVARGHSELFPYGAYETKDGRYLVTHLGDWEAFARAIGLPERLAADPDLRGSEARVERREELTAAVAERFRSRTLAEWTGILDAAHIWSSQVQDYAELFRHPQVAEGGLIVEVEGPEGRVKVPAGPIRLPGAPPVPRRSPPALGEHTVEVLRELGFTWEETAALLERGVAGAQVLR